MTTFTTEVKAELHRSGYRNQTLQHRNVGEDYLMLMQVKSLILKRKIDIPKLSRFNSYLEILNDVNADKRMQSYAKSEISRLILILHHIKNLDQWHKSFQIALTKDSIMPDKNEVSTIGANTLFEMYLAARFEASGVSVNQAEPDLICEKLGFKFSVAAKRIRSKRKLKLILKRL